MADTMDDFTAMLAALETARVVDLVRYVGRRMREEPELRDMEFGIAWNIMLGGYGQLAANAWTEDG